MSHASAQPDQALLMAFWKASMDRVIHYETQRERVTAGIFVLAGLIVTAMGIDKAITPFDAILAVTLMVLGAFGTLFCMKNFARRRYHYARARAFRRELDSRFAAGVIESILERTDEKWERKYGSNWLRNGDNLQFFWVGIQIFLLLLGGALLALTAFSTAAELA